MRVFNSFVAAFTLASTFAALAPNAVHADSMTLPGASDPVLDRTSTLTIESETILDGVYGTGNATVVEVNAANFGGAGGWVEVGEVTEDGADTSIFSVTLTSGSWDGGNVAGDWNVSAAFPWADLAISMHVGNGEGDPDHFIWWAANDSVAPWEGSFVYTIVTGGGGGLSNLKVYGRDTPDPVDPTDPVVPEPSSLALMGLGLAGLAVVRRRKRA